MNIQFKKLVITYVKIQFKESQVVKNFQLKKINNIINKYKKNIKQFMIYKITLNEKK